MLDREVSKYGRELKKRMAHCLRMHLPYFDREKKVQASILTTA